MSSTANLYNVWSNFMYFVAGLYSILIVILNQNFAEPTKVFPNEDKGIFILLGIFIIITGVVSCVYHVHTPSWKNSINIDEEHNYSSTSAIDTGFSMSVFFVGLLFFLMRLFIIRKHAIRVVKDPVFYLVILFGIISLVFFLIAQQKNSDAKTCPDNHSKKEKIRLCIKDNHEEYDIYHSNWHLFTGIFALFGITLIKHTYNYE